MKLRILDGAFLVVHGVAAPSEAEWDSYLAAVDHQGDGMVELVLLGGPGPTRRQRAHRAQMFRGRRVPTAILSNRWATRIATALRAAARGAWEIEVFPSLALGDALAYLGLPSARFDAVRKELARLQVEERVEERYGELLNIRPEARHCGRGACALWSNGPAICTCRCAACVLTVTLLHQAHVDVADHGEGAPHRPGVLRIDLTGVPSTRGRSHG